MSRPNPKISIVIPSFNQAQFLERTLKSLLNQGYDDMELIVCDGLSTDGSIDILEAYKDRIHQLIIEKDKGQSDAINKGFRLATGDLVGWLNSDDTLSPNCLKIIADCFKNAEGNEVIYYSHVLDKIDESDRKIGVIVNEVKSLDDLLNSNYSVSQPGSFYSRKYINEVEGVDVNLNYCMDLDLWLKLLKHGGIYKITHFPLAQFRIWGNSKTTTGGIHFLEEIERVLTLHGMRKFSMNWFRLKIRMTKLYIKNVIA
jgi:glycosyltransferase involved in cell wall biosynthesis